MSDAIVPWPVLQLKQLASDMCLGKMLDKDKNRGEMKPYLRNVNVRWFGFDLEDLKQMRFEESERERFALRPGDLVVCEGGEPGRAAVWTGQMADARIQKALHRVRFDPSHYVPRLAMYFLFYGTITHRFARDYTGTTIKHLTGTALSKVDFPVPPVAEQQRIVDALDELLSDLDAGVKALEGVRAKLRQYRAAVLNAAMEGTLTAEWRKAHPDIEAASELLKRILAERRRRWEEAQLKKYKDAGKEPPRNWKAKYTEPVAPDTSKLPLLPGRWCWVTLGHLLYDIEAGKSFNCVPRPAQSDEWGVIKVSAMSWGEFDEAENKAVPATRKVNPHYEINTGDLLLSRANTYELVGASVLVNKCRPRLLLSDKSMRLLYSSLIEKSWLKTLLSSPRARGQLSRKSTGTKEGMRNVSQESVLAIALPLAPAEECLALLDFVEDQLSVIDHLDSDLEAKLKSAQALRQSILKAAFEGKLVPQDPSDEPASELLKRIAAERAERERLAKDAKKAAKPAKVSRPKRGQNMSAVSAG